MIWNYPNSFLYIVIPTTFTLTASLFFYRKELPTALELLQEETCTPYFETVCVKMTNLYHLHHSKMRMNDGNRCHKQLQIIWGRNSHLLRQSISLLTQLRIGLCSFLHSKPFTKLLLTRSIWYLNEYFLQYWTMTGKTMYFK